MEQIETWIAAFFADLRVQAFIWLVIVHLLLKVADAIRTATFDFRILAAFYRERIVPYVVGALALYLASRNIPAQVVGPYANVVGEGMFTVAWLFLVANILADIIAALKSLGYPIPGREPPDV